MKSIFEYKAAIFDLDGTLADSMHVWNHICRDWLLEHGKIPHDELERDIELMTLTQSAEYVQLSFGVAMPAEQIIAEWHRMAVKQYEDSVTLKDGAKALLRELAAGGVKLAIATSCFPAACEAVLRRHGIREYFPVIVYSDEINRNKSFPDIWLACAERLGVAPEECIAFDDLHAAAGGIRAAGMSFVAVYDDSCKNWATLKAEADLALTTFRELCTLSN